MNSFFLPGSFGLQYLTTTFTEPLQQYPSLAWWKRQGLYVVLAPNTSMRPRQFDLLYVGETANLPSRLCDQHEKCSEWRGAAAGRPLYFAWSCTDGRSEPERKAIEAAIIKAYNPPCNVRLRTDFGGYRL